MNTQIPQFYDNKDLIYDEIWNLLSRGVVDRGEDFRLPTVILNDGKLSDGRVVVLRGAFKDINTIRFHTDYRSDKIRILKINNNICFVFYNKKRKIQVRIKGIALIIYLVQMKLQNEILLKDKNFIKSQKNLRDLEN